MTSATNNTHSKNGFGRSGCTVRTDSHGNVYVFDYQFAFNPSGAALGQIQMITSNTGGATWSRPRNIFGAYDSCSYVEPSIGRCTMDGVAGARSDLSPDPSVDLEMDVAWIVRGKTDPAPWIEKFAGRIAACHVKDVAPEGANTDEDGWADIGEGTVPWEVLWPLVVRAGATLMIAEHDNPSDFERFARTALAAMEKFPNG